MHIMDYATIVYEPKFCNVIFLTLSLWEFYASNDCVWFNSDTVLLSRAYRLETQWRKPFVGEIWIWLAVRSRRHHADIVMLRRYHSKICTLFTDKYMWTASRFSNACFMTNCLSRWKLVLYHVFMWHIKVVANMVE
jgi:hypothetical protein